MVIEPIAYFHSPFTSKFGVPRQSGIVSELKGTIVFSREYSNSEALRGLDDYDYLWLIWGFSENADAPKHATVRPHAEFSAEIDWWYKNGEDGAIFCRAVSILG